MANRGDTYTIKPGDKVTYWEGFNQWSAIYVNGELKDYGDHSNINERLLVALGFDSEQSDDFMLGTDRDPAETLQEAYDFRDRRVADLERAAELRRQAAELEAQAGQIEAQAR